MAARYFINGGVDNNWSTSGNWSATSGGAASGVKPTAADDVFFDINSPNCTINSAGVGKTITFTGYVSTITMTFGLTISGSVTLVAAMTIAGTADLSINATSTITSNGKTWGTGLHITSSTVTLADNLTILGNFSYNLHNTLNGNILYVGGDLRGIHPAAFLCQGTTSIVLNGTGIWSTAGQQLANSVTINTSGTITISGIVYYRTGTFTYTAGTVVATGSTLYIIASATLNLNGIILNNFFILNCTVTLTSDLYAIGQYTYDGIVILNGNTFYLSGDLYSSYSSVYSCSGTTIIYLNGTTTWTTVGAFIANPMTINTTGTINISTGVYRLPAALLYTAGTVTTTAGTWTTGGGGSVGFFIQ